MDDQDWNASRGRVIIWVWMIIWVIHWVLGMATGDSIYRAVGILGLCVCVVGSTCYEAILARR